MTTHHLELDDAEAELLRSALRWRATADADDASLAAIGRLAAKLPPCPHTYKVQADFCDTCGMHR